MMSDALAVLGLLFVLVPVTILAAGIVQILVNGEIEVRDDGLIDVDPGVEGDLGVPDLAEEDDDA